jgi:riboflavin kinase/FMN adenylyltransferase
LCQELTADRPDRPVAVTFGVYDGVHQGHRHVLATLCKAAKARGFTSVVVTLSNHPLSVLRPEIPVVLLTSLRERIALLESEGVERVIPVTFTLEMSRFTPERFMRELFDCLGVRHFVVGPDFALGRDREGTLSVLEAIGFEMGYTVEVASHFDLDGVSVHSSAIRETLANGDLPSVERFLGRRFSVDGPVVEGEGRGGGLLGFPTANIGLGPLQALPEDGIYATWATIDGKRYGSATSVGIKPTFHDAAPRVVEAFILDFDGDLYSQHIRLEFVERLRGQEKYDTVDELVEQIVRDVKQARTVLSADQKET